MKSRILVGFAVAAVVSVVSTILYLDSDNIPNVGVNAVGESSKHDTAANSTSGSVVRELNVDELDPNRLRKPPTIEKVDPQKYTTAPPAGAPETNIFKIVMELGVSDKEKVRKLLSMLPSLPDSAKVAAFDHATQLIADADYTSFRPELLRLATTEAMQEVLFLDVLTRDDTIKMTGLVELMKQPIPKWKQEAREVLEAYLDVDHGDDPIAWESAVQHWVANNAEA